MTSNRLSKLDQQTIIEFIVYILESTGGLTRYNLMKTLYFAHRKHLATYGTPLVADRFHALEHGPVPTWTYDAIKRPQSDLYRHIEALQGDASSILRAKRQPDMDYLSQADVESLDYAIAHYASRTFGDLRQASHDDYWQRANERVGDHTMSTYDIARSGGASDDALDYLAQYLSISVL